MKSISELRQDLVSGAWVVIATGRAKRPHEFLKQKRPPWVQPRRTCPFEKLHADSLLVFSDDGNRRKEKWFVQVIPNKYPAFGKGVCALFHNVGPYQWTEGVGFHEVVITRDHSSPMALMSDQKVELVLRAYQERYLALKDDACVEYVSIFHNHGRASGATISHPHSQIVAIPVIPPDVGRSLKGSAEYFHKYKSCVHCAMLRFELKSRKRLIYENENFAVYAPYASRTAFEIRILPKRHSAHFEEMDHYERLVLANALRVSLFKLYHGLKNPDHNFFIHTAPPTDSREIDHYHWHIEILPKTAIWAGFEIGTGIDIATIAPETAASFLKKIKVSR